MRAARIEPAVIESIDAGTAALPQPLEGIADAVDAAGDRDAERLIGTRPARWWPLAGSWLAVALSVALGLYVNYKAQGIEFTFGSVLMAMIPHYCVWLMVSPPLYRALHRSLAGPGRLLWASMLAGWSGVALAGSTAMSYFSYILRHDLPPTLEQLFKVYIQPPIGPAFWAMNFSILATALAAFAAVRSHRLRLQALWGEAQSELRQARLEAQLAETRLAALQAQINPHFLLNSLNAIASLVQVGERERAFDAIGQVGELLRMALRGGRDLTISLAEEVEFLRSYLQLCELRFESQFSWCLSMAEELGARRVPAMIVQPLIENCIKHGMDGSRPLHVDVRLYRRGAELVIEVEDDGRGVARVPGPAMGHGLANVSERLRLCFEPAGRLSLEPRSPRGTLARIVAGG